jgi:hypothetical protein
MERLDPTMLIQPQTQKEKPTKKSRKYTKETRERNRKHNGVYIKKKIDGFNLLKKWVPGTETSTRPALLMETVNYIKELLNKVNEKECTQQAPKDMGSAPKITVHHYGKKQDSALREPHTSQTDISEPEVVKTFASTPTGASMRKTSSTMDAAVQTTSEAESVTPEEELLGSPDEELLANLEEELLASEEELLASEEELPEFDWTEDLRQWLEL